MTAPVRLELRERIAVVTLNAPPLNLFDLDMRDGLIEALRAVRDVPELGAMVLRAEGRDFSAGADLRQFGSADSILEARRIRWDRDPWGLLWELPVFTIAALHGITLGSGLEMALLCDIRLASADVRLGLPETAIGMIPAAGGTQSLTRALGPYAAAPYVLTGVTLDATESLRRGLIHRVVDDVDGEAVREANRVGSAGRDLVRAARAAIRAAGDLPLEQGLALEKRLARLTASSQESQMLNTPIDRS
jgi:enoyl-CoA hydratase/carnithine racemase